MTIDETYNVFFEPLHSRIDGLKNARSIDDVLEIMCPEDLVYSIATGADYLTSKLRIQSHHQTHDKIAYTLNRAKSYSTDSLMPLWNEMIGLMRTEKVFSNIGQILDWAGKVPFGDILGKIIGLKFGGGLSRGDWLIEHLDKGNKSLINVAKYDFNNHIKPAIIYDFG